MLSEAPLARLVVVAPRLAVDLTFLPPARAAVAVPLAPERAALAPARVPPELAARLVLVAPDLAWVAVRLPALRALVPVAFAPLAAARDPALADEEERLGDDELLELDDDDRFGAGIGLLVDLTTARAYPISSSSSAFCAWRRFSA
jgi:hypothetical protein